MVKSVEAGHGYESAAARAHGEEYLQSRVVPHLYNNNNKFSLTEAENKTRNN